MKKSQFTYDLPAELIAQAPLPERSASRLLSVHKTTGALQDLQFTDLLGLLKPNDLLVFNNTKVIPARLFGQKITGGQVEMLIERIIGNHSALAHVKASKSPKPGTTIRLVNGYQCRVIKRHDDLFELDFTTASLPELLGQIGHIPLPPYIRRSADTTDESRYQTVFAKEVGAVAAPTAGLHFDEPLLEKIAQQGIASVYVTLHVGSGTFQPVRVENLEEHVMHKEFFVVPEETVKLVQQTKAKGGRVVAIGTTAVRALEAASQSGQLAAGEGDTNLFITPGYVFNTVDAMLTNFHLPESTLLMLVSAFAGYGNMIAAYHHAIQQAYRFFSYGDAMFIAD